MNTASVQRNESQELLQLVSFHIEEEEYGVDILNVQEIIKCVPITKVPNSPEFVEGVINLRGRVIPILDLRYRFGFAKKEKTKDTRIIVVETRNNTVGFIVDAVNEVLRISANITEAPPSMVSGIDSEFIKSVGKLKDRMLILIDLNKVLTKSESEKLLVA